MTMTDSLDDLEAMTDQQVDSLHRLNVFSKQHLLALLTNRETRVAVQASLGLDQETTDQVIVEIRNTGIELSAMPDRHPNPFGLILNPKEHS